MKFHLLALLACLIPSAGHAEDTALTIEESMIHVRGEGPQEWSTFPSEPQSQSLERTFRSQANPEVWTLSLRQQDVKQSWDVRLNDQSIGRLVRDENDLRADLEVPVGVIIDGENRLEIRQAARQDADDVRVGQIQLHHTAADALRGMATVQVALVDETDVPMPGRITVVNQEGTLMPLGVSSGDGLAVRHGVVYTATGDATFGVQPGVYRIYGGRGLEYSIDSARIRINEGERAKRTLKLTRQVDTGGWVACDTHVHTVTHSGHGDCTVEERMATLAGEGIELPIATDHNKHIDYRPTAKSVDVLSYFTPVIGNEVTTKQGHFNIFPVQAGTGTPDHTADNWDALFDDIFATPNVRVAILNHARDIHSGFRPFSPRHHLSLSGENLDDWRQRFTAMEVINSGAVQTDAMELFRDWCGLINQGLAVTPVGCSDSHDVARYIVGQGRTYIRCDDADPGAIDVEDAIESFSQGHVVVSYGLFNRLSVNQTGGPGDLVKLGEDDDELVVNVEVHGPEWTKCDWVELYVNGLRRFKAAARRGADDESSLKASVTWRIPRSELRHDVWVAAVATGPGIQAPHWATAKPYQPDSPEFEPYVLSSTGAVRVDADGDGRYWSPREHAGQIVAECGPDLQRLVNCLSDCDASVIHQTMSLLRAKSIDVASLVESGSASAPVRKAFAEYQQAWRASVRARLEQIE